MMIVVVGLHVLVTLTHDAHREDDDGDEDEDCVECGVVVNPAIV